MMSVVIMYVTCTYAFSHCKKWFTIKLSFAEKSTLRNFFEGGEKTAHWT